MIGNLSRCTQAPSIGKYSAYYVGNKVNASSHSCEEGYTWNFTGTILYYWMDWISKE